MSTRCLIGIEDKNGEIRGIYCHHDGIIGYVGKILNTYYKDKDTIEKLLAVGDMSCIGKNPIDSGWDKPRQIDDDWFYETCEGYRERANTDEDEFEDVDFSTYKNREEFIRDGCECWAEYLYLFSNGEWLVQYVYSSNANFVSLKKELEKLTNS